ncbi:MAG TPA: PfkB family carbohydrate kinase [Candidatus Limnocylindrales bacterium]|nr:PfkB family carbohydrate kinase [Candidatus Limnocylindrales bacterium]
MSAELVCVGLATRDLIVSLPRWPEPDGRLLAEPMRRAGGGPAATAAVAAARLGRDVSFIGAVGSDSAGRAVRDELEAEGVDVSGLEERAGATSESVILLDRSAATRSILHAPGAALDDLPSPARARCETARWIHVDHAGWPLVPGLPRERISIDAGNPVPRLDLAGIGLYAPTEASLRARYGGASLGACVLAALDDGAHRVVVTLGRAGAVAADAGGAWRVGPAEAEVVSTLGAGDVFHGALLAGLLEGLSLPEALRMANVAAALSCRGLDGREAIPSREELRGAVAHAPAPERSMLNEEP